MRRIKGLLAVAAVAGMASGAALGAGGTSGAGSLNLGVGARSMGMGGTGTAGLNEPSGVWINPALVEKVGGAGISFMHGNWLSDISMDQFSTVYPAPLGTVAAGLATLRVGEVTTYDSLGYQTGKVSPNDLLLTGAWALPLLKSSGLGLTAGVGATWLKSELLADAEASTVAGAVGACLEPMRDLSVGLSLLHLGPGLKYDRTTASLPATVRVGGSYRFLAGAGTVSADVVKPAGEDLSVRGGAEYMVSAGKDVTVGPRLGYRTAAPTGTLGGLSAGAGVTWRPPAASPEDGIQPEPTMFALNVFRVDYAWTPMGELGSAHWFTFVLLF
jgi:hypothetical protein